MGDRSVFTVLPWLVAALIVLAGFGVLPAGAEPVPDLKLRGKDTVEIELRADKAEGVARFFLQQVSGTAATEVSLDAVLSEGTVTFSPSPQVVPPSPASLAVTASVSGLTKGGVFEGELIASTGGGAVTVGQIVVRKTPKLEIRGTGESGIKLTHPVPEFQRVFTIVSNANTEIEITLEVDDFLNSASVALPTKVTVGSRPYDGGPFTVAAGGSYAFTVSASLLGDGDHTSVMVLKHGDERFETPLTVTRTVSDFSIPGIGADGIELIHPIPEFQRAFTIVSSADTETKISLTVDDFISEASVASPAVVTVGGRPYGGEPFPIPPGGSYSFTVSAVLQGADKHTSRINLKEGAENVFETRLTVTRTNVPPTVRVDALPSLEATRGCLGGAAEAPLRIAMQETGGRVQVLTPPELVSLVRKDGTRQLSVPGELKLDAGGELRLGPYEARVLPGARLTGLARAGEFSGTIRFQDGTGGVIDQPVSVFVRDHFFWAFLWILLGVVVSSGLHHWFTNRQKKFIDRNEIVLLEEELERLEKWLPEPAPRDARQLLEAFRDTVEWIYGLMSSAFQKDTDARLGDVREKVGLLRRWLHAAVRAEELGVRRKYDGSFELLSRLLKERNSKTAEREQLDKGLTELETALDSEKPLPLDELDQRIDAMLETTAAGSHAAAALLRQKQNLAEARAAIGGGESEKAETLVEEVRNFLASTLLLSLRDLITGANPAPGVASDRWKQLQTELRTKITAAEGMAVEEKVEEAGRILGSLLGELIPGLRDQLTSVETKDQALAKEIREAAQRLEAIPPLLAGGAVGAAAKLYEEVGQQYLNQLWPRLVADRKQLRRSGRPDFLSVPLPLEEKPFPQTAPPPRTKLMDRLWLEEQFRFESRIVWAILVVIAVVLGMHLLYVNDPDWGGWADYLVAVLWGLGVHSVGNVRSVGVHGLREQFGAATGK